MLEFWLTFRLNPKLNAVEPVVKPLVPSLESPASRAKISDLTLDVLGDIEIQPLVNRASRFYLAPIATERTPLVPKSPGDTGSRDSTLMIVGILSFAFLSSLDGTIVATLLSTIGSLQSMQFSSWDGTTHLLSQTASILLFGQLANILGRRPSIMVADTLFGVATVLCAFAQKHASTHGSSIGRDGGSGLTAVGSIILSDFTNLLWGFGAAVGAPLGGWLGDTIGWRAAFIIQAPILACGLLLVFFKVREPPLNLDAERTTLLAKLKRIDYAGTFSLVGALLTFVVGMNFKTILGHKWDDIKVWGVLDCFRSKSQLTITISPANIILRLHVRLRTSANAGSHFVSNSLSARTPEWVLYTTLMPVGLGSAGTLTTTLLALIAGIPPNDILLATGREVFGVSLSTAPTQTLLARELRRRIVYDGADKIIAKTLASTAYIDTLPAELQAKANRELDVRTAYRVSVPNDFSPPEPWAARGSGSNTLFLPPNIIPSDGSAPELTGTDHDFSPPPESSGFNADHPSLMTQEEMDEASEAWEWIPSDTIWLEKNVSSDF
ncbi:major facilitator superfamily domain-containing protein [Mycena olivaceomarginata]|nr:major facilitator superfamily domain-containing protein [Mycena olivaceomarginata]